MVGARVPRWVLLAGAALLVGSAWGVALRLVAPDARGAARAAAAWLPVFGAAVVLAASARRDGAAAVLGASGAAIAATLCAGGALMGSIGAGFVVFGAASVALGLAVLLRRLGVRGPTAALAGMALPALLAGAIFVADPFIEWGGSTPRSGVAAAWVLRVNPIAAATSNAGGLGVDWQTMPLLYDGAGPGSEGLSVIGQYYPTRPPSPIWWGAWAGVCAALLLVAAARLPRPGLARPSRDRA